MEFYLNKDTELTNDINLTRYKDSGYVYRGTHENPINLPDIYYSLDPKTREHLPGGEVYCNGTLGLAPNETFVGGYENWHPVNCTNKRLLEMRRWLKEDQNRNYHFKNPKIDADSVL